VARKTTVAVGAELLRKLHELKRELGARSVEELLRVLVERYEEYEEAKTRRRVREVMCNDFRESKASLAAWGKLLAKKFTTARELATALEFLTPLQTGVYGVRCEE